MDNYFITKPPFTKAVPNLKRIRFLNKVLRKLKLPYMISRVDSALDMNTLEQRINYFHLLDHVLVNDVEGDIVELGCFTGQCALLFQKVIQQRNSNRSLHLYDSFDIKFTENRDIETVLLDEFKNAGLNLPILHKGAFETTLPDQLPAKISFTHIDCGFGGNPDDHTKVLLFCLPHIYERMTKGAVCILMDYYDENINGVGVASNPGVKTAIDVFLADKQEQIVPLYGSHYFHAYFRKE